MMKKIILWTLLLFSTLSVSAQEQHVFWKHDVIPTTEKDVYEIKVTAYIDSSCHIYDTLRTELGPNATIVNFDVLPGKHGKTGAVKEGDMQVVGDLHKIYDDIFMMEIGYYEDSVSFIQKFRLDDKKASVKIYAEWMVCNDMNCSPLLDREVTVNLPEDEIKPAADVSGSGNLWSMIIEAFIWGLVALLTPCIFPMVPMTVSFFMKGSADAATGRKRAALYGLFIVLLYTLPIAVIILITRIFGGDAVTADIFNWLATNWLPNILFFLVFITFALSFFGLFEITLPGSITTKTDSKANSKGVGGIFFMALTLVLVSFSCTGPIVGTVMIKSVSGEFWTPIVTMLVFSIAFAFPFTLLAMFPSWLKKLPKSGGWLGSVKIILGFVETALAFKFLSMADQAYHWRILPRDLYLAIWIVICLFLILFMFGVIPFKGVERKRKWSVARIIFTAICVAFEIYMVTGLFGAPLKALSGYLPPMEEKGWFYDHRTYYEMEDYDVTKVKYGDKLKLPHGLQGFFDLNQARAFAEKADKPLFIDFSGHACVNCREMESRVWSDERVLKIMREDYIIVALYCDDKMEVDERDWVKDGDKTLKTLGKINSQIGFSKYGVSAQPCYILEGKDGEMLAEPRGYNLDVEDFIKFLEKGKANYQKNK